MKRIARTLAIGGATAASLLLPTGVANAAEHYPCYDNVSRCVSPFNTFEECQAARAIHDWARPRPVSHRLLFGAGEHGGGDASGALVQPADRVRSSGRSTGRRQRPAPGPAAPRPR